MSFRSLRADVEHRLKHCLPRFFHPEIVASNLQRGGIHWRLQLLIFLVAVIAVVSRRPDAIFNAQFFGEDGRIWYRGAYATGWFSALLHSQNGYFQTLPRLAAALALLVPLRFAPLLMNLVGITFQVLPVNFLLSSRCANWGPVYLRALMATIYIALPNTMELDATVEEAQWHLALLACLLILASRPNTVGWRIVDISIVLLSGLSGPFGLILLPLTLVIWYFRREPWLLNLSAPLALTLCLQIAALIEHASKTRPHAFLGATPKLFVRILAERVYLGALIGQNNLPPHETALRLAVVALLGTTVLLYCFVKARLEWKVFLAFCTAVFAASLRSPMVSMTDPQWQVLEASPGIRYWFFPMLAFAWALLWCAISKSNVLVRILAAAGLLVMCFAIEQDWIYPAYPDLSFPKYAKEFDAAPAGTLVKIPIFPEGWVLQLTKKGGACRNLPEGNIDQPASGARVPSLVPVAGWVSGPEPIQRVSIYIDRTLAQSVIPNVRRTDVDAFYPQDPNKYKGFGALIDFSHTGPGTHEIEVRALEADGCDSDIDQVKVER